MSFSSLFLSTFLLSFVCSVYASVLPDVRVLFLERYVRDLMSHMTTYLVEMSNKNDIKKFSQQPDIILSVSC